MRVLMLTTALAGSLFLASEAQAQGWGRMYGTGYSTPDASYSQSYYPGYYPGSSYYYYPSYQGYPGYSPSESRSYYDNGYYNNYNLGYSSGLYAPPYRSYYAPGAMYRGYQRGY